MNHSKNTFVFSARTHYTLSLRVIHWLTVVAILAAYILANFGEGGEEGEAAASSFPAEQWHYVAGLAVLLLVLPRLVIRFRARTPPIVPAPAALTDVTARLVHLALYLFLIVEPILGWLQVSYAGERIILPWLGWTLPALVHPDPGARELVGELHELIGNIFYAVIALHVLAALWHHFLRRDNTLKRIL